MKKIRSNFVKESLLDYENLSKTLKENTSNAVRDLLNEAVRETYDKILSESFDDEDNDDEYEVEEVKDTNDTDTDDNANDAEDTATADVTDDAVEDTTEESEPDVETEDTTITDNGDGEVEVSSEGTDENGNEWAEFDKYKVSDDEYDFSKAEDDEIVRVYKLLKDEDQVCVNVTDNKLDLKDNETGAEYIIDLDSANNSSVETLEDDADMEDDIDAEGNFNESKNMANTQKIFEIALNEYDSNVGYTDNYQKKDVMTTPDMSEPGKNVNDWDAGVPKGKSKPWSSEKKTVGPFNGGKGKTVEEDTDLEECGMGAEMEEANLSVSKWNDTHAVHNRVPAATDPQSRRSGSKKQSQGAEYKATGVKESKIMAKAEKILAENKKLKSALMQFRNVLQEASVTNVNLGQIIKLISENATTKEEKQDIIARFGKEANTIEESKQLYDRISNELKKNASPKTNITEDKQFTANSSKMINESKIYQSDDLLASLDLMHRLCK